MATWVRMAGLLEEGPTPVGARLAPTGVRFRVCCYDRIERAKSVIDRRERRSTMTATIKTIVGTGAAGCSDTQVNDPFGLAIGADGALYFCEVGNSMIRRLDLQAG